MIEKSIVIRRKHPGIKEKMSAKITVSTTADLAQKGYHPVSTGKDGKPRISAANFSKFVKDTDFFQKILFRVTAKMAAAKEKMKSEMKFGTAERKAALKGLAPAVSVATKSGEIVFDEALLADYRAALDARMKAFVEWYNGALKSREFKKALKKVDRNGDFTYEDVTKGGKTTRVLSVEKRSNNAINIPRFFRQDFISLMAEAPEMRDVSSVFYDADNQLITSMPQGLANKVLRLYLQRTGGYKFESNKSGKGYVLRFDLTNGGGIEVSNLLGDDLLTRIETEKNKSKTGNFFDRSSLAYTGLGVVISKLTEPADDDQKKQLKAYYDGVVGSGGDFGARVLDAAIEESTKEIRAASLSS